MMFNFCSHNGSEFTIEALRHFRVFKRTLKYEEIKKNNDNRL